MNAKPRFVIKNRFQKRTDLYCELLTEDILRDVCFRITGIIDFDCDFDDSGYNKGRLATLYYGDAVAFITFSETSADGRNSSFQSVTSALASFYECDSANKSVWFYFLYTQGNYETDYFCFMYRLMKTSGIHFLNDSEYLSQPICPFISVNDLISLRRENKGRNKSNNSTFVTRDDRGKVQVFGKTYGASKYETALICIALTRIVQSEIEIYEIREKDLDELPTRILSIVRSLGARVIPTNRTMERNEFDTDDSLRSPRYTYNLFVKLGQKRCALCGCEIPELIQGAHIWQVSSIKHDRRLTSDEKLNCAVDGDNGLWLCENHHRLFDENIITINENGYVSQCGVTEQHHKDYIDYITTTKALSAIVMTDKFRNYLKRRYR